MFAVSKSPQQKISLSLSWRTATFILLAVIIAMLMLWRPWQGIGSTTTRKVSATGDATLKSEPDQYTLNPYFEFTNPDRSKATEELTKMSTTITAQLKKLGVTDQQIASTTNAYDKYDVVQAQPAMAPATSNTLQLSYTIKIDKKELAQTVQDYMVTLNPKGQISPMATFSESKRKELESQARVKAIDDAKAKADKTAKQLGAKLGKVITISDGASAGGPIGCSGGLCAGMSELAISADSRLSASVPVQPGQDDFTYHVQVEYELK